MENQTVVTANSAQEGHNFNHAEQVATDILVRIDEDQIFKEPGSVTLAKKLLAKKPLELCWLDEDPRAFRFFCNYGVCLDLHLNEEVKDYDEVILCNGEDCIICKVGLKSTRYFHLPVYQVATNDIAMLAVPRSMEEAVRPLIQHLLRTGEKPGAFISQEGDNFTVVPFTLSSEKDCGDSVMDDFLASYSNGDFNCFRLYHYVPNCLIVEDAPAIGKLLKEKGLLDQRQE